MLNHPIVHVEFSANDREASGKFYHDLFGWEVKQIPEMDYATFSSGEGSPGGGLNPVGEGNPAGRILVYVHTDDINATLQKVQALGGKIVAPCAEIPGVGLFAVFTDLTGNEVGLLEPTMQQ